MGVDLPKGLAASRRYLLAYLEARAGGREALLRFPPGVTLGDAGHDWPIVAAQHFAEEFFYRAWPTLHAETVERLLALGVEIAATGQEALDEAFRCDRAGNPEMDIEGLAEDYLRVNDRLGGDPCVTIAEYAMHTMVAVHAWADGARVPHVAHLHDALNRVLNVRRVPMHGDVAFRTPPDRVRIRVSHLACIGETRRGFASIQCELHSRPCAIHTGPWAPPHVGLIKRVRSEWKSSRIALRWRDVDDVARGRGAAQRAVAAAILGALPEEAWREDEPWPCPDHVSEVVAATVARTCEEYRMLVGAMRGCESPREVVRRAREAARDPSWVVSRTLERLSGRW